ncbi:hypothetical protein DPMN_091821 [Dreissena polymorpha]|uniref:Glucose-methanol-choline oxidoreductase N-terminal domain-containing protein n=1 Tax=Dreissena polymorpha TaxID=45954 RepID=A0A9D4QZG0_DREPO|nr:hypothetical protein DPMN_091821 [Dreissena polymorpha]
MHVAVNAHVTKDNIEGRVATGVTFIKNNKKNTVYAKRALVLSAGSIGSPQILMLSGIDQKEHLESFKIPLLADLAVCRNLEDHMFSIICGPINISEAFTEPRGRPL